MSSVNKAILVGSVGKDPEVRRTNSGDPIVSFSLATSENWRDKTSGERKERTTWHNVVIFNEGLAKIAESYVKKGSKLFVEGAIQTRKWQDQSGADRYTTEIVLQKYQGTLVLLSERSATGDQRNEPARPAGNSQRQAVTRPALDDDMIEDSVPF